METAEITQLSEMGAPVGSEAELEKVHKLVDLLEDHDDVQSVYKRRNGVGSSPAIKPNC